MIRRLSARSEQMDAAKRVVPFQDKQKMLQQRCDHIKEDGKSAFKTYGAGKVGTLSKCEICELRLQWNKEERKWIPYVLKSRQSSSRLPPPCSASPETPALSARPKRSAAGSSRSRPPPTQQQSTPSTPQYPPEEEWEQQDLDVDFHNIHSASEDLTEAESL